jgi:diguanylate cyclase (GGDEF)-like protein
VRLRFALRSRKWQLYRRMGHRKRRVAWRLGIRREHDSLTGLRNRFWLEQTLQRSLGGRAGALVLVDLDDFGVWNYGDRGWMGADQMLVAVAFELRTLRWPDGCCFRIGGNVFVLLLPDADLAAATADAERTRVTIKDAFAHLEPPTGVTRPAWVTPTATCSVIAWTAGDWPHDQQAVGVAADLNAVGKAAGRNAVVSAEINWQSGQIRRLLVGGEERELFAGAPLNTLIGKAHLLYHRGGACSQNRAQELSPTWLGVPPVIPAPGDATSAGDG